MTDEELREKIITPWREANEQIVNYWYAIERAAMKAVRNPGTVQTVKTIQFNYRGDFLRCKLPSGRKLWYCRPTIEEVGTPWGDMKDGLVFWGMKVVDGKTTTQWAKVNTRGPKLVENITQAFCRDLLAEAMLRLDAAGYNIIAHIHDEVLAEERTGEKNFDEFCKLMAMVPCWAEGMPIEVDGWTGLRFRK